MKKIFTILSLASLAIGLLGSCTKDYSPELIPLDKVSMSIIPDYSDGSVYNCSDDGSFFLRVAVTPEKYLGKFSNDGKYIYRADFRKVTTRAESEEGSDFSAVGEVTAAFEDEGYMTVAFTIGSVEATDMLLNDYAVSFSIRDRDGGEGVSTAFVPVSKYSGGGYGGVEMKTMSVGNKTVILKLSDEEGIFADVKEVLARSPEGSKLFIWASSYKKMAFALRLEDGTVIKPQNFKDGQSTLKIYNVASDMTVILEYLKHTVTFNTGGHGTAPAPVVVLNETTFSKPEDPVAEGYFFCRWCSDPELTHEWDFTKDKVTEDLTLYAKWDPALGGDPSVDDWDDSDPEIHGKIGD